MGILMTPAYLAATTVPLHHARIGWMNLARTAIINASSIATGSYLQAPISDLTYEWWQPTVAPHPWWSATFASPTIVNYAAVAVHEIGSVSGVVKVQVDQGAGWVDVADTEYAVPDDSPFMILFEDIVCNAIRIYGISGTAAPRVGIIHYGKILEMPRPIKWMGHTPAIFNRNFEKRPNTSERGQRLGVSLIRQGLSAKFTVDNLDEYWCRDTFDLFIVNALRYGYFVAWRPDQFPDEVLYGWSDKPIIPVNSQGGINRKMSVTWDMECHTNENIQAWES